MNKIFLIAFVLAFTILIVSCVPPENSGEKTAMAGLAISKGCYDVDNDGYGARGHLISSCKGSRTVFDCTDSNKNINPGAREMCGNRIDDNCNGRIDEVGCVPLVAVPTRVVCSPTPEVCDGIDNNCDGRVDEEN
ncbi:MAG: putative metal-binding motif-containing protein, partial [Candidatus Woesearchaeota archaeon]|nr:putative metal-binding motif-containing protein [Candidatus Woesearchaeota archaeon]